MKYISKKEQLYLALKNIKKNIKNKKIESIHYVNNTEIGICCILIKYNSKKEKNKPNLRVLNIW